MDVKVIASGSDGNCAIVGNVMIDAGISFKRIQHACNFDLPNYLLITHEHRDHANISVIKRMLERGVEVFMTEGTRRALELEPCHNLRIFKAELYMPPIRIGNSYFVALNISHDAAEPVCYRIFDDEDTVLYATDTRHVPMWTSDFPPITKCMIEANHFEGILKNAPIDAKQKARIAVNHLSVERVVSHFRHLNFYKGTKYDTISALKEIHILHVSKRHADVEMIKTALEEVVNVPVTVHR